jgi:hypothetical protein
MQLITQCVSVSVVRLCFPISAVTRDFGDSGDLPLGLPYYSRIL